MKTKTFLKIALIGLSTFLSINSIAQPYHPLVDENKVWSTIDDYYYLISGGTTPPVSDYTKFSGDTLINGKYYKKILNTKDSLMFIWNKVGYAREDTVSQQVFFMDTLNNEGLVYDFNVSIGDTIHFYDPLKPWLSNYPFIVVVDSVYQTTIDGSLRKVVEVCRSDNFNGDPKEIWIEGIGDMLGLLKAGLALAIVTGWHCELLCYYENGSIMYHNPNYPECYYTNITNVNEPPFFKSLSFYPNPTSSFINIQIYSHENDLYISIYDMMGKQVKKIPVTGGDFMVDCSDLQNGLYLLFLKCDNRILSNNKLIINKYN